MQPPVRAGHAATPSAAALSFQLSGVSSFPPAADTLALEPQPGHTPPAWCDAPWLAAAPPAAPATPPPGPAPAPARPVAAIQAPSRAAQLPVELLACIVELVAQDDKAQQRRQAGLGRPAARRRARSGHTAQFVSRAWLAAYRGVAYRRLTLHVATALRRLQRRRGLSEGAAAAAVLQWLAARLPYAEEVVLAGVPQPLAAPPQQWPASGLQQQAGPHPSGPTALLAWQLGELLLAALAGSSRLRRLSCDSLPHLPLLLAARAQLADAPGCQLAPLEELGVTAMPAAQVLCHLPLLQRLPLRVLGVSDAACLPEEESTALAAALGSLTQLSSLSLGGSAASRQFESGGSGASSCAAMGQALAAPSTKAACGFGVRVRGASPPPLPPLAALPASPAAAPSIPGVSLPALALVAAAAGLPRLQQLELSLTFSKQQSEVQQAYLQHLGCVLRQQRSQREAAGCSCMPRDDAGVSAGEGACACACQASQGSRVSVTVHEHVQGDLSAVPVASCSLNLDWDDESNPIEARCAAPRCAATLRRLLIAAQLPLQAGQFRPARLAALQVLEVAGCCYIPAYFAEALCSMQQLRRLALRDCQLEAIAAVPWQEVLPRLPLLTEVCVERCSGAVLLHTLWLGLAGCANVRSLRITGGPALGGGPPAAAATATPYQPLAAVAPGGGLMGWQHLVVPGPPAAAAGHWACYCASQQQAQPAAPACGIPDCVALLQQLRSLDLSHNGLHALPDALAWCQQLSCVTLRGNRLLGIPRGVAALGALRKLDLSSNQVTTLDGGPYLPQLEELLLGGNPQLLPSQLPLELLVARRLCRLGLPAWWRAAGAAAVDGALLAHMPWLLLEHS
ncbi:hypothetical protein CHLNCDRAFT_141139 [Chlorella variabilis]|uniref:Uncharacterized protein n=1 Tax=Chlorella variabilis TaxID=554065 RepID=E1ZS76_CHLVA|nr:hypothetical protein CHLNCDRAFT_141139 [Chlorella variabilis]EFN51340.1 hypothetical protein CHLNCDRAFT_141139 [Chlorella variabilis]|eukprot:XP_005843442.1 hypothetical protein CHLNCDRAFT_141139 [Chlorella variabilis]